MKELTIEEKAKSFNEALSRAKGFYKRFPELRDILEKIFSELREPEDERIKEWIMKELESKYVVDNIVNNVMADKAFAWLEKQGESYTKMDVDDAYLKGVTNTKNEIEKQYEANYQIRKDIATFIFNYRGDIKDRAKWMDYLGIKVSFAEKQGEQNPTDKVEPKFKVGDWVVYCDDDVDLITGIKENGYCINNGGYIPFVCESDMRLWTIEDAKDGDVLAYKNDIVIFKENNYNPNDKSGCMFVYCSCNNFYEIGGINPTDYKPATKEQRDALMKAMADAGYTFDFEKKELKKIEQKPTVEMKTPEESLGVDSDTYNKIVDECVYGEQKSAWSEEDESHIRYLIECLEHCKKGVALTMTTSTSQEYINWLKSLKPQNRWKESLATADLENSLCDIQDGFSDTSYEYRILGEAIEFIRCTESKPQWKPSEEQMECLSDAIKHYNSLGYPATKLKELLDDLKKLREE